MKFVNNLNEQALQLQMIQAPANTSVCVMYVLVLNIKWLGLILRNPRTIYRCKPSSSFYNERKPMQLANKATNLGVLHFKIAIICST